jgi:TPR repeat protein
MPDQAPAASPPQFGPTPEDVLRAVFLQALTGKPATMPAGATVTALREALVLDPAVSTRIFNEAKSRVAAPEQAAGGHPNPPAPAHAPPASSGRAMRLKLIAGAAALFGLAAIAGAFILSHKPLPTDKLFAAAATSPQAYSTLLDRAKSGDPTAQFALAALLDHRFTPNETVAPKNDALAFAWYTMAAEAGFPPAEQALGFAYLNGHGVARDPASAAQWYMLAASKGLPVSENALGFMYQSGTGVPQDNLHAIAWYTKAAMQGLPMAENNLGNAYESGVGVTQDYAQAAIWFTQAAKQGEPNAQNSLGYLYFNGIGIKRDQATAAKLFAAAAAAGNPAAQVNLGLSYANGQGVPKNPVLAAAWCYRAQAAGAKDAAAALALISPQLTPQQIATAKAEAQSR